MAAPQGIRLEDLPLPQLQAVRQQLDEEIKILTNSFSQLKLAQSRFLDALESINALNKDSQGKTALIPLTTALYVSGQVSDVETVIVDVGTGYFVEKSVADAKEFYNRKLEFLKQNLDKVGETVTQKRNNQTVLLDVMAYKMQQQQQQQAQAAGKK